MDNNNNQLSQIFIQNRVVKECFYSKIPQAPYNSIYRHLTSPYFYEQEVFEELQCIPIIEKYLSQTVEEDNFMDIQEDEGRIKDQQPYQQLQSNSNTRYAFFSSNIMRSQSSGTQFPSRNSSVSSLTSQSQNSCNQVFTKKLKTNRKDTSQTDSNVITKIQIINQKKLTKRKRQVDSSLQRRQRLSKINKIKEGGCNCKKSKCLKMYCQCFNLRILCGQNCNCIGCGNMSQNENHHKSVLEALTRNPKAFAEDLPTIDSGFRLGVQLSEVRKGCKCRKTQCKKKYCECFNSGVGCGKFCQCEQCENNKVICK